MLCKNNFYWRCGCSARCCYIPVPGPALPVAKNQTENVRLSLTKSYQKINRIVKFEKSYNIPIKAIA